jgi:Flp pilus assembly pilin Flp
MTPTAQPTAHHADRRHGEPFHARVAGGTLARGKTAASLGRFAADEQGASAIEYAVMAMFFSVTVIGGSSSIRNALQTAFSTISSAVLAATNG